MRVLIIRRGVRASGVSASLASGFRPATVTSILKNPFYAGAYVYGKGVKRTEIVDGRVRKSYGHCKPASQWGGHHMGISDGATTKGTRSCSPPPSHRKAGGVKSDRGRRALLPGLLSCGRCGRS
ncbi:recombinase family protein [Mesorhizobium sp.]|uniref:recombinase family protein n=1 Tax=Mesorhizobium sp. TaxID=1871066 RepID=UPI000FE86C16|nr:recombinase family protein [Mesorhizobium sp.]RWI65628.1 MAG: hypothetical protein EOR19_32560 [Mesorhizobium sp.]